MSLETNKALARREAQEIESQGNFSTINELLTPDLKVHFPGFPTLDAAGFRMLIGAFRTAFPDMQVTFEDQLAEDDRVSNRLTMRGTHQGDFQGVPASGKNVQISGINIMRVENDRIAEIWGALDVMSLMQQIGALPSPEAAGL